MRLDTLMSLLIYTSLGLLVTAGLAWSAAKDVRTSQIPRHAGYGILVAGLISLGQSRLWLASIFYLTAIWASGGVCAGSR